MGRQGQANIYRILARNLPVASSPASNTSLPSPMPIRTCPSLSKAQPGPSRTLSSYPSFSCFTPLSARLYLTICSYADIQRSMRNGITAVSPPLFTFHLLRGAPLPCSAPQVPVDRTVSKAVAFWLGRSLFKAGPESPARVEIIAKLLLAGRQGVFCCLPIPRTGSTTRRSAS